MKQKLIKCQDCDNGKRTAYCTDPMCREPELCGGGTFICDTCKGASKVFPDDTERYWAIKYYSKDKKRQIREKKIAAQKRQHLDNLKYKVSEIKRMEKEILKLKKQLKQADFKYD